MSFTSYIVEIFRERSKKIKIEVMVIEVSVLLLILEFDTIKYSSYSKVKVCRVIQSLDQVWKLNQEIKSCGLCEQL